MMAVATLGACGGSGGGSSGPTITGRERFATGINGSGNSCTVSAGGSKTPASYAVSIFDADSHQQLASGHLDSTGVQLPDGTCAYYFTLHGHGLRTHQNYQFNLAGGTAMYTNAQLAAKDWTIDIGG